MVEDIKVQYVTDELGNKKAVLIPRGEWESILKELVAYREMKA